MRAAPILAVMLAAACANEAGLVTGTPRPSPTPIGTVTAAACAASPSVGPTPVMYITALNCTGGAPGDGNADFAMPTDDTSDHDGDAFLCGWLCTADPRDTSPPHEMLERWNLTAEDGDFNSTLGPPVFLPCCSLVP